ncbi:MAG: M28 family peptidase [Alphaproteobacteria bacterium]|nr:M28 family peptidase [Alphaproteobacteria bacterium]MBV9371571.1 M28 family peptidase [Alphaproteobacteria bacterium]MBV9902687.1 M28 family peptidase [Alphaproteobacteria bacterium]
MIRTLPTALALALLAGCATAPPIRDADTRAWWRTTADLSSDRMEGRDTGSAGYERAAAYVAERFRRAGLVPAGEGGTYFQRVPLSEVRVEKAGTAFEIVRDGGAAVPLRFLHDINVRPTERLPAALDAPLAFRGYCSKSEMRDVRGRIAICFNARRTAGERNAAALAAGAAGLIAVDNPYFTVEPPRWPAAYARTVRIAGAEPLPDAALAVFRLNADAFAALLQGSGRDAAAILAAGGRDAPLAAFDVPARLRARLDLRTARYSAPNVLAVLPGTDLKDRYLVLGAHLDGYGRGEPVDGDGLYNGTLDDAAYVALLARLADNRKGRPFRRSVLFAAFTGEEKGLLGSNHYVRHPTVPLAASDAMINLDQLRPLFPLDLLTMLAVDRSSLGETARAVAGPMGIRIQADPEPERGLLQRADHWPFLQAGIPATGFIFGYVPGTEAERRYRLWYRTRYHHPADDLSQPMDFAAAAKFNSFFYRLVEAVADAPDAPRLLPSAAPGR